MIMRQGRMKKPGFAYFTEGAAIFNLLIQETNRYHSEYAFIK